MLIRELDRITNFTLSRSVLENQNPGQFETILKEFLTNDIKIIIGIFDVTTTLRLFCEVYKQNMYGENYQWIILGTYNREIITEFNISNLNCTQKEILTALNGTMQTRVVQYAYEYEKKVNLRQHHKIRQHNKHHSTTTTTTTTTAKTTNNEEDDDELVNLSVNDDRTNSSSTKTNTSEILDAKIREITEMYASHIQKIAKTTSLPQQTAQQQLQHRKYSTEIFIVFENNY